MANWILSIPPSLQGTSNVNLYAQTHAMAIIMDDIETEDKVDGRGPSALPTWVRAQFRSAAMTRSMNIHDNDSYDDYHDDACCGWEHLG